MAPPLLILSRLQNLRVSMGLGLAILVVSAAMNSIEGVGGATIDNATLSAWKGAFVEWKDAYVTWANDNGCPSGSFNASQWLNALDSIDRETVTWEGVVAAFKQAQASWHALHPGCKVICKSPDDPASSTASSSEDCLWDGEFPYGARVPVQLGSDECKTTWMAPPTSPGGEYGTCTCASPSDPKTNADKSVTCSWAYGAIPNGNPFPSGHADACATGLAAPDRFTPIASALYCSCPSVDDPGYTTNVCHWDIGYVPPNLRVTNKSYCFYSTSTAPDPHMGLLKCQPAGSAPPSDFYNQIITRIKSSWSTGYWAFPEGSGEYEAYQVISSYITKTASSDIRSLYATTGMTVAVAPQWTAVIASAESQSVMYSYLPAGKCDRVACFDNVIQILTEEFSDVAIVANWLFSMTTTIDQLAVTISSGATVAGAMVATQDSNSVTPPKPIGTYVLDLVGLVINAITYVAATPIAIALSTITTIVSDVQSDPSDAYWNVYTDAGETGREESLVQSTLEANIYRQYSGVNQYEADGWSSLTVSKCPSDCGKRTGC
eukprot:Opistho-2@29810